MSRIKIIENCGMCPECGLIDVDKTYCLVTGDEVNTETIPDNCPLPENTGRDLEAELARMKRQLREYRTLYSGKYGKF